VGFWLQYCSPAQTFGIMAVYIGMSELLLGIDARFTIFMPSRLGARR